LAEQEDARRLPRYAIENLSRKRKTGGDRAYDALAGSTCRLSFSYSSFLVPCYVPSSLNAVRMLHNTSPVADLFKLSHDPIGQKSQEFDRIGSRIPRNVPHAC